MMNASCVMAVWGHYVSQMTSSPLLTLNCFSVESGCA